jgi:DNA-binding XRE family transcriptional regulator
MIRGTRQLRCGSRPGTEIRRIEIIFSGNTDQREQGIPPRIGQRGSHALRRGDIADLAHRPFRRNPFAGRMRKNSGEAKETGFLINLGRLDGRSMRYSSQVRAARALLGWSQGKLARAAGVGLATLQRIEQREGVVKGNFSTALKIQKALEAAGILFTDDEAGEIGVRLKTDKR